MTQEQVLEAIRVLTLICEVPVSAQLKSAAQTKIMELIKLLR